MTDAEKRQSEIREMVFELIKINMNLIKQMTISTVIIPADIDEPGLVTIKNNVLDVLVNSIMSECICNVVVECNSKMAPERLNEKVNTYASKIMELLR
jgi:ribonuclease HII